MKNIDEYKEKAVNILQKSFSNISTKKIERVVDKYIKTVTEEVNKYLLSMPLKLNYAHISTFNVRRNAGRYQLNKENKETIYISKWFDAHLPLYSIYETGSNLTGKLSIIKMNYELNIAVDIAYDEVNSTSNIENNDINETLKQLYGDYFDEIKKHTEENPTVDIVPINLKSLKAYIDKTQYICDNNNNIKKNKLKLRIRSAKNIYAIAKLFDGNLIQVINESEFGRRYYKGPNLQSAPKEVRHAALGDCIEFDISNSVYAWRYAVVKEINPSGKYAETLDYLDRKKMWREELANHVFGDIDYWTTEAKIKIIKGAFTAISFGAKGKVENFKWVVNGETKTLSLNSIITSAKRRKLFLEHKFVSKFIGEQKEINKAITKVVKKDIKKLPVFEGKRFSANQALSYLYQQQEREIIEQCKAEIPEDDFLLLVHDAFYVRKLSAEIIVNIKQILSQYNTELKLGRTDYKAYTPFDYDAKEHKEFMKKEKLRAKNYKMKSVELLR